MGGGGGDGVDWWAHFWVCMQAVMHDEFILVGVIKEIIGSVERLTTGND